MAKSRGARAKTRRHESAGPLSWDWFDRELVAINATLARLKSVTPRTSDAPVKPRLRQRVKARTRRSPAQKEGAATAGAPISATQSQEPPTQPESPANAPQSAPPAEPQPASAASAPPAPTGTDLADPKNFGLMPPTADLVPGPTPPDEYRKRLARHLAFANKVLHTSRVPAPVWREWRAFEKAVQERLRATQTQ